jgi:hypothetical protein
MPKKDMDYSRTIIYRIVCKDTSITDCYVGHTTNFTKRKCNHKSSCNNEKEKNYNLNVYQFIRNNGGWDNFNMIEIEKYPCNDANEALKRERYNLELYNATLNSLIPSRTRQEWKTDNKEHFKEYKKKWHYDNKEKRKEKMKEYYENNKEKLSNQNKKYYEDNKNLILEINKEKITCKCGCLIVKGNLLRHQQTQKHLNFLAAKTE